jgi:hypothetical protein
MPSIPAFDARRSRRDVDDAAPFALAHAGNHRLRAQEHRLQVDRDGEVEIRLGQRVDRAHQTDARVVHQHVDRPQRLFGFGHHPRHLDGLGHIGAHRHGPAALVPDFLHDAVRRRRLLEVIHGDGGTGFGQRNRHRLADPPGAAGHQGHAPAQIGHSPLPKA